MSTDFLNSGTRAAMGTDTPCGTFEAVIGFVALMLIASATPMAHSQSLDSELIRIPIVELKRVYLACNRAAIDGRLNTGGIMHCSVVYEELKRRAFGGDFHKLLAWSKVQPPARITGR
jgi:hypothetical protein